MRSLPSLLSLSLALTAVGCVDGAADLDGAVLDDPAALEAQEPALSETTSALCFIGTVPPAANWIHSFVDDPDQLRVITNYGTDACADYTVRLDNGGSPYYQRGYLTASVTNTPNNAEACVGTSVTIRKWTRTSSGSWTSAATTEYGEWTASGCDQASNSAFSGSGTLAYMEISTKRSYCPSGGPWCSTTYGLPLKVKVMQD